MVSEPRDKEMKTSITLLGSVKVWDPRQKDLPVACMSPAEGDMKRDCWTVAFGDTHSPVYNTPLFTWFHWQVIHTLMRRGVCVPVMIMVTLRCLTYER